MVTINKMISFFHINIIYMYFFIFCTHFIFQLRLIEINTIQCIFGNPWKAFEVKEVRLTVGF